MKEEKKLLMVVRTSVGSIPQWIFLTCSLAQGMDIPEHVKNVKERIWYTSSRYKAHLIMKFHPEKRF